MHQLQFQLLGTKAIAEVGLFPAGFHKGQTDPRISPHCTEQPAWAAWQLSPAEVLDSCLPVCASETPCTPEPGGSWWGLTTGSSADCSAQGRRGTECGREWGLPRAKCSTLCAAGSAPQGRDGILQIFPRLALDFHACTKAGDARQLLEYCINREQAAALPSGYSAMQISPQHASPTHHGCLQARREPRAPWEQAARPGHTGQAPFSLCLSFSSRQ